MVDHRRRIIDLEAGWPGSVGDARIWQCSSLNRFHKTWLSQLPTSSIPTYGLPNNEEIIEEIPAFILGDSAYPNTRHVVMTYKVTEMLRDETVSLLNKRLGGARYTVENAFGIMKQRFQIFKRPLECAHEDVRYAITLTMAIFVLHNFLIDIRDDLNRTFDGEDENVRIEEEIDAEDMEADPVNTRNILLKHI